MRRLVVDGARLRVDQVRVSGVTDLGWRLAAQRPGVAARPHCRMIRYEEILPVPGFFGDGANRALDEPGRDANRGLAYCGVI